jgi:hypothetical protein
MTMRKNWQMTRIGLLTALAVALCMGASCKKAPDTKTPPPAPTTTQKAAQPAVPPVTAAPEQTKEAPKPAEPAPAAQATGSAKLVPINIELPKPMFVGTPQDTKVDNLEKPLGKPRPPFLAP